LVQQISALIVQPAVDASKYTAGAQEKVAADKAMAASSREAGAAAVDTSAKISTGGDVLSRLSRQYVEGYAAQQRFSKGLGQLSRGLETGRISIEGAERILIGMNQRLGLTANAAELAAKGQMTLASAVERANVQIARQANDLAAADAANRRMQAANSNVISAGARQAAGYNAGQQIQDIAMMSLVGQSPGVLALQQGPQLATAIQQGGGLAALGAGLTSLLSVTMLLTVGFTAATAATIQWFMKGKDGAKSLDDALKAHSDTLKLLKDQYGALGEAAKTVGNVGGLAFTDASARNAQALLQAQLREKTAPFLDQVGGAGFIQSLLGNGGGVDALRNLSGDQKLFAPAMAALIESAKSGKTDLASFNDEVERLFAQFVGSSDNPARLRATADAVELLGNNVFSVTGKFAPFADAINRLKVAGPDGLATFNAEIQKIGQANGIQKLADELILAGKEIVSIAQKATELEKILQRIDREETRPGLADRRSLGGYVNRRAADLDILNSQFDADQQLARARTNAEKLAAIEAQVRARAREDADKGGGLQVRVDRALAQERTRQEIEARDAAIQRSQALDRSLAQQRLELDLIGKTGGEQAKLRFEFERMQELRDQAARTGGPIDDKEVASIKAAAEEMGKYADALARAKLADDLQFEREQLFRSPLDQQIASRLRGTGIGLNSPEAQQMRDNQYFADVKGIVTGFLSDFEAGLMDSGGDIGKALGRAVLGGLNSILDKIISNLFDQIGTSIASSITGVTGGGAGAGGSLLGDIGKALMGGSRGANDNYAPGAITRAALPNIGGSSSDAVGLASGLLGLNENTNASQINSFLRAGGVNLDAASQAWCAAFVNSSLKQIGVDGSGSNVATSFLNWGQSVNPADVLRGDVLVQSRGLAAGQLGGHVGFATGATRMFGGQQQLQMLSGNTSDKVGLGWYNASEISARRAETALDKLTTTSTQAAGGIGHLGQAGSQATQGLGTFASTLSQFQAAGGAAPTGWNGVLGSLFGGATGWGAAGNWLAANPGGYIGLWDEGGYTGPGGKYEAAGIVHKGEYVLDADTVMRAGGPHALDGLRKGLRGYADGGFVGAPVAPAANQNSRTAPIVNLNVINNAGASVQTQERQEPDGSMTLDVIVDRVVAEKLNTRGTATNNTLRQGFGAQQALKRR
jgi:uncharacterized protein (TIGR02594 family)